MWLVRMTAGWFTKLLLNLVNLRNLFGAGWHKFERKYIQEQQPNQFQPEHGFCQQNGSECSQVEDWYPDEKMVVLPISLNGRCCSLGCMGVALY